MQTFLNRNREGNCLPSQQIDKSKAQVKLAEA